MTSVLINDPQIPNLSLKALDEKHAKSLFALIDNSRDFLSEWLPWVESTLTWEDSHSFITFMNQQRIKDNEYGYGIFFNDKIVGHISLMHVNTDVTPEIGYWIDSSYAGKGIATNATHLLASFTVKELGVKQIVLRIKPDNIASNRVAEKVGFRFSEKIIDSDIGEINIWYYL